MSTPPPTLVGRLRALREPGLRGYLDAWRSRLLTDGLGPVPAMMVLILVWAVFQLLDPSFLSSRNLSNLSVDIVGTGLIATGLVFVLLIGEIDLAAGALSGFTAALFAVLNVHHGMPEVFAVLLAVAAGCAAGALHGLIIAKLGVASFAVTLAAALGWSGMLSIVLGGSGTVTFDDEGFVATLTRHHFGHPAAAYGLAALVTGIYFLAAHQRARYQRASGGAFSSIGVITARTAVLGLIAFAGAAVLNQYRGLPLALLIFLFIVAGLDYGLRRTSYGRTVHAQGGNAEAARRAGLRVVMVQISVFMVSGTMAALGGVFLASRTSTVGAGSPTLVLLVNAVAAAVIGGTSLFGGRGRTWSALLGILVIQSVASGMALLGLRGAIQITITAGILMVAVIIDSLSHRPRLPLQTGGRA
ncbi:sugar ABC transporter permease [Streptomyces sindenensis]|uniref:sugar ABC transporter permease n=1 Tax=Streptomyces sindenensis TaxID=67363 RepID=UPI0019C0BB56|nr:sugar ABC transporter permease [Streptomyces sindenensis]GGP85575.1 ABC transporter permease [Streptomyces sindenensis]